MLTNPEMLEEQILSGHDLEEEAARLRVDGIYHTSEVSLLVVAEHGGHCEWA